MSITTILIYGASMASAWFLFKKMGREGWAGLIPFYNNYILCDVLYGSGWKSFFLFIPLYNIYFWFRMNIDLAKKFHMETGFGVGMSFLPFIFRAILGFNDNIQFDEGQYSKTNEQLFHEITGGMNFQKNDTDEIQKYKKMCDDGIISREEFEAKKKQILKI